MMSSVVGHLVESFAHPPRLSAGLLLLALLVLVMRWRKTAIAIFALATAWSLLWSIPLASDWLRSGLEDRYPSIPETALPRADAIVVLGGGHYGWLRGDCADPYALESSRLAGAARAWLAGRAPYVVLSGAPVEVRTMSSAIARLGVPSSAVLLEADSLNTQQNAMHTATLAQAHAIRKVILTTSALHMPRAMLQFNRSGLDTVPFPIPEGSRRNDWRERWLPSRGALWRSGRAFKEYLGIAAAWAEIDASPGRNCAHHADRGAGVAGRLTRPASPCCPQPDAGAGVASFAAPRLPSTGVPVSAGKAIRAHAPIARGSS